MKNMGTKGTLFGYLEFSRAIRGKPWPHARATAGGDRPGPGPGPRTGSLPVRFFSNWVLRVWGIVDRTRSASRIRTETAQRLTGNRRERWAVSV